MKLLSIFRGRRFNNKLVAINVAQFSTETVATTSDLRSEYSRGEKGMSNLLIIVIKRASSQQLAKDHFRDVFLVLLVDDNRNTFAVKTRRNFHHAHTCSIVVHGDSLCFPVDFYLDRGLEKFRKSQ